VSDDLTASLEQSRRIATDLLFACRDPNRRPDFFACGGPAAEAYWEHFTPARVTSLLDAVEAVLKLAGEWDDGGTPMRVLNGYRGRDQQQAGKAVLRAVRDCADQLRGAISSALATGAADAGRGSDER
jgi:hypothetical protein